MMKISLPAGVILLLVACGTETGNPEGTVNLEYNARSTRPDLAVDAVWLRLDDVALTGDCAANPTVVLDGLGLADHSGADAALQQAQLPDRPYCTLTTGVHVRAEDGDPDELEGISIQIEGDTPTGRPFVITVREPIAFELDLLGEPLPAEGAWLLSFDVGTWVDLEALEALADPIEVSDTVNADLLDAFIGRVPEGVMLHHDIDSSGTVDEGERQISDG